MNPYLEETIYFDLVTSSASGAAADADVLPTAEVFEDATDTTVVALTVVKRASKTGNYRVGIACTAANGFELNKSYNVVGTAVVGGNTGKDVLGRFQVRAVPLTAVVIATAVTDRFATIYTATSDVPGHDARLTVTGTATGTPTQTSVTLTMDVALNAAVLAAHFTGVGVTWNPGTRNGTGRYLPILSAVVNSTTSLTLTFASPGWPVAPAAGEGASISG
jgi:hypothetical protein